MFYLVGDVMVFVVVFCDVMVLVVFGVCVGGVVCVGCSMLKKEFFKLF